MKRTLMFLGSAAMATLMLSACAKNGNQATNGTDSTTMMATNNAEANKAKTHQFYEEVMNGKKLETVDALCAADFTDHNPEQGHTGKGTADLKKTFGGWFAAYPDMHMTIDNMVAEGDMVATMFTVTGTWKGDMMGMKANGKSFKVSGTDFVKIKDGKATDRWGTFDVMGMLQQLGIAPMPGGDKPAASSEHKM
jgi:steroid delta-isomerase-like uncharacterized protein